MSLITHNNDNRLKISYNDMYIGNVYSVFPTLKILQTY